MAMTPAMESIFANAQQNAASLIETATLAINAKVNTVEEAEAMIQELSSEAVKFNELLTCIMNAIRQVESGDMQKEEAAGIIAPAVKELKDKCTALKIANVEAPGDDITEEEIATLRELIIGAKAAAEDRLVAIRLCDDCKVDPEVENELNPPEEHGEAFDGDVSMESYEDIAEEATFLAYQYVNTTECKTAKALYQNAKKLYSMGSKEKALEYMKKAKGLYEGCLKKLMNESGKFEKAERTEVIKKHNGTASIRHNVTRTDSMTFAIARSKLENKIDRCTAHILQWTTKAGKETYQQTLDQLKADRAQAKAAKKAAKATENYEMEDTNMILTDEYDQMLDAAALEAMDYEEIAEEGVNWDQHKMKKSYSKEVRSLAKEAKKLYRHGKYTEAKNMYNKCVDLCKQFIADVKAIPQEAKDINFGSWMYALRTMFIASDSPTETIDRNIELLNKQGKGELTPADFNRYTTSLISEANALAKKYQKLADKAAKGELDSKVTESFDYDEFMFAAESYMDELQLELDTDFAMEADGIDDGSEAPSTIGNKLRSALAKFKGAFKRGDKAAAEEAKKEVEAAADELASAEDGADEKKKAGLNKAAKIGLTAAATVATIATLTTAAIAISQKAKGEKVDVKAGAKAIKQTVGAAMHNFSENQKNAAASRVVGREERKAAKKEEQAQRANQYFVDQTEKRRAAQIAKDNRAAAKYNAQKAKEAKRAAKIAAKAAKEAFGVSEYDAYEAIFEAMMTAEEAPSFNDEDLAASIEAML